ncbi:hypothetical protein [Komagataeibacter oboediens]|uniref:hypothetical protein n=1 Tax=Komagataeibacter oboediens TaxID=65958 RepID=UPI001908F03E|nr:hypothetical protein [Komagataeibacter oboediens]GCE78614.1 hypothetical protein MSKU3_0089 [Komagataeibacter oboediens]
MSRRHRMPESRTRNTVLKILRNGATPTASPMSHDVRLTPDTDPALPPDRGHDIPFYGHRARLHALGQWMADTTQAVSVQIVTGGPGMGKTRLGMELAARAREQGWMAGFLSPACAHLFNDNPFTTVWHQPTLVIIDNAASLTTPIRAWLRELGHQPHAVHPFRIVLLERAGLDTLWVNDIFGPDDAQTATLPAMLSPAQWPDLAPLTDMDAQYAVFSAAYRATAGKAPPADTARMLRHRLDSLAREGSTLFLTALGTVAAREGLLVARTLDVPSLLSRVVNEEIRRIRAIWHDGHVPETVWPRALHLLGISLLCGGLPPDVLRQVAEHDIADEPPTSLSAVTVADACLHALRLVQPGHDGCMLAPLPDLVAGALGLHLLAPDGTTALDRLWACPQVRLPLVAGISRACHGLWDRTDYPQPIAWLDRLLHLCGQERDTLRLLACLLPRHGALAGTTALDAVDRLATSLRDGGEETAALGRVLTALFHRHADLWHAGAARRAAQDVLSVHNRLATRDPTTFRPALAAALHDIAAYENGLDNPAVALPMARQALAADTALANDDPGTFRPGRAAGLFQVARCQHALGQSAAAMRTVRRAIVILTILADDSPVTFQPGLAAALVLLSSCQASMQQHDDARETALDAVILYTTLAHGHPDAFRPVLADSLHQLALRQLDLSQHAAALKSIEEAFSLQTAITEQRHDAGMPETVDSLITLSRCQNAMDRGKEAYHALREAVRLCRALAEEGPEVFRPALARTLVTFSTDMSPINPVLSAENMQAAQEAADLYTALAHNDAQRFTRPLAHSLMALSHHQKRHDRIEDAIRSATAAVRLYMDLARRDPDAVHAALSDAFSDLADLLAGTSHMHDLTVMLGQMLDLQRDIVARNPDNMRQRAQLGTILIWRAGLEMELGRHELSLAPWREGLRIRTELAALDPETFAGDVRKALETLSYVARRDGQPAAQCMVLYREVIDCLEPLAHRHPATFTPPLISTLETMAHQLVETGQPEAALQVIQHAISIHHGRLDQQIIDDSARHAALARSMDILAHIYRALGRYDDMRRIVEAMLAIHEQLVEKGEPHSGWELARKHSMLAVCQMQLGQADSALASTDRAVALLRALIENAPPDLLPGMEAHEPALAANLTRAAALHETLSQHKAALQAAEDAMAVFHRIAGHDPDDVEPSALAQCLQALPRLRQLVTGRDDFLTCMHDAVALYRGLDAARPERFRPDLARFLVLLCTYQWQGQLADALQSAQDAASIYAGLYDADPARYRAGYADSLYKVFLCHNGLEQLDPALAALKQTLSLYRTLATDHPQEFRPRLAQCLLDLAQYLMTYKEYDGALHTVHEATSLLTDLAQTDRATFQPILKKVRAMHTRIVRKRSSR